MCWMGRSWCIANTNSRWTFFNKVRFFGYFFFRYGTGYRAW
jgi:hypothetical protein